MGGKKKDKIDKITLHKNCPRRKNCRRNILNILEPALTMTFVAVPMSESNASGSSTDLCLGKTPPSVKRSLTSAYHLVTGTSELPMPKRDGPFCINSRFCTLYPAFSTSRTGLRGY